ncbi:MAG: sigma-70 family RNA polymerase sigma factor [Solirubrobacterales bacterium]|nr:sigma-70 family RNA polymerase sigma factor [Solirubrobacterales bacterium]
MAGHRLPVPGEDGRLTVVDRDPNLLDRLRAGDGSAFEALVTQHDQAMRRVARTIVRTPSAADDVVQETWLAVISGLDRFEERSSLRTWIYAILIKRARSRASHDARSLPFSALENDEYGPTVDPSFSADGHWSSAATRLESEPETNLLSNELRAQLVVAIGRLPPSQRAVITLRDALGLSAAEVCSLLEVSVANQRVLLHRARAGVRVALAHFVEVRP